MLPKENMTAYDKLVYDVLEKWVNSQDKPPGNTYWISIERWENVKEERGPYGPTEHSFWIKLPMGIWVGPENGLIDDEIVCIVKRDDRID